MRERKKLYDYWENPGPADSILRYVGNVRAGKRSTYLVGIVRKYVETTDSILELGCNVGRNLCYLYNVGYRKLLGIDINELAVDLVNRYMNPIKAIAGTIEERIDEVPQQDLIFTMAVLMHLHPDSDFVFEKIAAKTNLLLTIENEDKNGKRLCARNYKEIFEPFGFYQVMEEDKIPGLTPNYICRVMRKR